ncbi:MAG TPA: hypothetical protein VK901_06460, partial [Nitrospiraceae bacterium]|nr:hypothetical protein [Nitrospiraceae bacterium]
RLGIKRYDVFVFHVQTPRSTLGKALCMQMAVSANYADSFQEITRAPASVNINSEAMTRRPARICWFPRPAIQQFP